MSDFSVTANINRLAGNHENAGWAALESQLKLIQDELKELADAIEQRDIHELRGEIADVLFTTFGMAWRAGINEDLDYRLVCNSQFTKFDTDEEGALRTKKKYADMGMETEYITADYQGTKYWVTKSAVDQLDSRGKNQPKGKWLKAAGFQEPMFLPLSDEVTEVLLSEGNGNVYHDHLDVCKECREGPMTTKCVLGPMYLRQQLSLTPQGKRRLPE